MNEISDKLFYDEDGDEYVLEYGVLVRIELPEDVANKMVFNSRFQPTEIPQ
jgi:hypothetical protein